MESGTQKVRFGLRALAFTLGLGLLSISALGPLASGQIFAAPERVVNLYSARHYDTDEVLYEGFTAATGVRVNLIEGDADQLIERIKAEARNSPADVLITVDAGRIWRAQAAGLFQPVSSKILSERVPASYRDAGGLWFGFAVRARVIAYSRERAKPSELSTYEALADSRWRGRLLMRSSSHVYNQSLVGALLAAHGQAWVERWAAGVVANFARPPQGGDTDQLTAVAGGAGDVALVNNYYYARLLNSPRAAERDAAQKIALFYPNQRPGQRGTHVNISGGGVITTSPNREAAVAFLEYLTSEAAQRLFARASYEYPVVAGIPRDPGALGMPAFKADTVNARVYGANNALALQIMLRAGWR